MILDLEMKLWTVVCNYSLCRDRILDLEQAVLPSWSSVGFPDQSIDMISGGRLKASKPVSHTPVRGLRNHDVKIVKLGRPFMDC